jgi:hypothetical protein
MGNGQFEIYFYLRSYLKPDFYHDFLSCKETKCPAAGVVSPDQPQGTDKFL